MRRVLRHRGFRALILLITVMAVARPGLATTIVLQTDDEMIINSRAIVKGKVVSVTSAFDEQHKSIFTYITLKVDEVLKGQITTRRIVLKEPGGEVGTQGSLVFGIPKFVRGERVILYLDTWGDGSLRVHHMFFGKFSIFTDPSTGNEVVSRSGPDSGSSAIAAIDSSPGTITDRMELTGYLRMLHERVAATVEQSQEFEAKHYSSVPVLKQPAEYHRSSSRGEIEPEFHLWNPPIRWFEADTGQPVVFLTNTDSAPNPQVVDDVAAAMTAWSTVPGCSLRVTNGGATTGCGLFALDGQNTISFNNCDGYFQSGSSGILAVASIANYSTSVTRVINGVTFFKALEGNISFNPFSSAYFGDHCQVKEITTHEMGHSLGLHHSWDPSFGGASTASDRDATMFYVAHFDGRCASLRTDDINGILSIYPGSGGGGGPLSITTVSPLANGTVGTAYSQTIAGTGGTTPYTWSIVAGSGTLPPGLALTASNGAISGTPTTTGAYSFTVKVTDSTSATAQKAFALTVVAAGVPYNSQFLSQTVPATLTPGQNFTVSMRFQNTGTQTWSGSNFYFVTQNPAFNTTWGGAGAFNAVSLINFVISSGQTLDATFTMTAPTTPGVYNFQWQIYQDGGVGYFGQMSTNVAIGVGVAPPPPPYQGFLDAAGCGVITGWGWDPTQPNTPVSVDVFDGTTLITTLAANLFREDIVNAGIGDGFHGFSFTVPLSLKNGTAHNIRVLFSGTSTELGNSPRVITCSGATPVYQGYHDGAGCNTISGWAWDATDPNNPVNVDIYDGATLIATVPSIQFRPDLVTAGIGNGFHGFSYTVPAALRNGQQHSIRIRFPGTATSLGNTPRMIQCTGASPVFAGSHEVANCNVISGWAWDQNDPNSPINVAIFDGSQLVATVLAIQFRQDLVTSGIGNGYHAFSFNVPTSLKNGQAHSIRVRYSGNATSLGNTPKSITCP